MPSRQEKKRAKRRAKYLEVRDDVLESARASYKADPEKKRTGVGLLTNRIESNFEEIEFHRIEFEQSRIRFGI